MVSPMIPRPFCKEEPSITRLLSTDLLLLVVPCPLVLAAEPIAEVLQSHPQPCTSLRGTHNSLHVGGCD